MIPKTKIPARNRNSHRCKFSPDSLQQLARNTYIIPHFLNEPVKCSTAKTFIGELNVTMMQSNQMKVVMKSMKKKNAVYQRFGKTDE